MDESGSEVSSDEDVDGVHDDSEDIHITFDTIKKNIDDEKINLENPQEFKKFKDTYKDSLGKTTSETHYRNTLLHLLVEGAKDRDFDKYKPLVRLIIDEHPDILKNPDTSGRTSLYNAISRKRNKLVRFICDTHPDINSVLEQPCARSEDRKETCVHAAIHNSSTRLAVDLIKKASKKVLCLQDFQGNTPLHSAVEYDRCTEEQLQIVQILAERGENEAMKKRTKDACLSPYLYHIYTRPKATDAVKDATNNVVKEKGREPIQGKKLNNNVAILGGAVRKDGEGGNIKTAYVGDLKAPAHSLASSGQRKHFSGEASDKNSLIRSPSLTTQMLSMNHERPSMYSKSESAELAVRLREFAESPSDSIDKDAKILNVQDKDLKKTTETVKKKKKEKSKVTDASANAIKDFLMLHCMRTLSTKDAEDFLYGRTQGMFLFDTNLPLKFVHARC